MNKDTSWGKVAEWYDEVVEGSDSYQEKVIKPNLIRVADPKKGMSVLEVACGQGYFARSFEEKGANVFGCDISKELIDLAVKNSSKEISYSIAPSHELPYESGKFDAAVIVLALQNIEKLAETMNEASRVLKDSGRLVIVLNHPAFRIPKRSSWQWDGDRQFRRIDSYMSDSQEKIDMSPGESEQAKKKFTISFHRPLQAYFKALNKAGFSVSRLEEWISHKKSQPGPKAQEEDRARKEFPLFICLEAIKRL